MADGPEVKSKWWGSFTLQLTAILLVIGLLPLLTYFALSYQTTQQAVLRVASEHSMEILNSQKEYIELQVEQVEALAANLAQVDEISASLGRTTPNGHTASDSYAELATKARLGYLLSNYRNLKGLVSIDVFSLNGEHYHVGDTLSTEDERPGLRDTLLARTFASGASVVWHGVEDNIQASSTSTKVVVATKLLVRPDSSWLKVEPAGMLVVNFSTDYLHDHFNQVNLGQGAYLLVLDDQQRLIYSPNTDKTGTRVPEDFSRLLVGASGSALQRINEQDMLLSYQQIPDKNWYVVSLVPKNTLLAPMAGIQRMGLMLLAVSGVLTVLLTHLFTARVVKPIGAVAEGFKRFQQGALSPSWRMRPPSSLPQVQDLVQWFNAFLESMAKQREVDTRLRIAATAFESQEGMLVTNAQRVILQVNSAFTALTGYSAEEAIGQTPRLMKSGLHDAAFFADLYARLQATGSWRGEIWNRRKDGVAYLEWLTITGVKDEHGEVTHYVGTMMDITQRKAAEEEIKNLAFYDALTMLPNRRLLNDRLKLAVLNSGRRHQCGALMLLDLDKFKTINDTLGHAMGDLLLRKVAERLVACVREGDTVARLGGDEFVVLLEGLSPKEDEAANQARQIGQKMIEALSEPHDLNGSPFRSSASFGATIFSSAACSADELMKQADIAMYQAKESGRNTLRFFDPQMQHAVLARASLETDMHQALKVGQFVLHFQPVMCGQVVRGAEVLVRWLHPQRGLVMPSAFIPLAEETGLIVPLGSWVLRAACEQLVRWATVPARAPWVLSVNVSAKQFRQPDFVPTVVQILEATGVNPARLKLEVTESLFISDMEEVIGKMNQLKDRGIQFSLDDFGTGYSSLTYLKRMPLSELKIDQSFVRDILTDPSDAITVRTILALGHSMGLEVLAEGVETTGQLAFLQANGCDLIQGYLLSPPLPVDDLEAWMAQRLSPG